MSIRLVSNMETSEHFGIQSYILRLGIIQNLCEFCKFLLYEFLGTKFLNIPKSHTTDMTFSLF